MIDYRRQGKMVDRPHKAMRREDGEGLYFEQCFTRDGFDGPYSILYHQNPPQNHGDGRSAEQPLWPVAKEATGGDESPLRRCHFRTQDVSGHGTPTTGRVPIAFNSDLTIGTVRPAAEDSYYFANGDADDLFYVQSGGGKLLSWFGELEFGAGDYVAVPQAVPYRFVLNGQPQHWFWMECKSGLHLPKQYRNPVGQLRMDAPYSHRDFRSPVLPDGGMSDPDADRVIITKRRSRFTVHTYDFDPIDVVGWDGHVYPVAFPISRFSPKIAAYHLPPTVHGTFATGGSLICSFVPRNVDFGEDAIPCPYPHSNVHVDEVIFYCDGDFTSRRGLDAGSVSYHPAGVPHGPHPGAYEGSIGSKRAEELAVMIDTFDPLRVTAQGRAIEAGEYDTTWWN